MEVTDNLNFILTRKDRFKKRKDFMAVEGATYQAHSRSVRVGGKG